jgi:hypothetical protein
VQIEALKEEASVWHKQNVELMAALDRARSQIVAVEEHLMGNPQNRYANSLICHTI